MWCRPSVVIRRPYAAKVEAQYMESAWKAAVEGIRRSSRLITDEFGQRHPEAQHLYLGLDCSGKAALIDRKLLLGHLLVTGDRESGKTLLGVLPLLAQLIQGYPREDGSPSGKCAFVVLDLKGDGALASALYEEAAARSQD